MVRIYQKLTLFYHSFTATCTVIAVYNYINTNFQNPVCSNHSYDYDSKIIKDPNDREVIGYAVGPRFQIVPQNPQEIFFELKNQLLSSKPVPVVVEIKPMKILVFHKPSWGIFDNCPQNPDLQCESMHWPIPRSKGSINSTIDTSLKEILSGNDFDAIFVYRSYQHRKPISIDFVYEAINNAGNSTQKLRPRMPRLVYFTMESPGAPHGFQMQINSKFTAGRAYFGSYWRGSDIYKPYFQWVYFNQSVKSKPQDRNYADGRTKMAAIVVSNCQPNNNRMGLVKELQQYITVDTFGKCGDFPCETDSCVANIKNKYKFYLAFENSNCRDYITEKLFENAYGNDLLPIVLGAHPIDYKAIAPEKSYIHVEDFKSIQQLGQYLQTLHRNDTLYNEYFKWKGTGVFISSGKNYLCEVCAFLHVEKLKEIQKSEAIELNRDLNKGPLPYFNTEGTYNFEYFNWTIQNERLCLPTNKWYWNK